MPEETPKRKPLAVAINTAFSVGLAASSVAYAQNSNPFDMRDLSTGYMVADAETTPSSDEAKGEEGKCGEGKCGEGKCGGDKAEDAEGKCGGDKAEDAEGKCGEGKCGSNQ
jgi:uncharacterized low-complexity protein